MKKLILSFLAVLICFYSISQSPILIPFRAGNKWGYSDTLGKIKIQPRYDTALLFDYNMGDHLLATVKLKGKPMVINEVGAAIVPPNYDRIDPVVWVDDAFYILKNGKFGVFRKGKELFPPIYDYMDVNFAGQYKVHRSGKWGLINNEGKIVIPIIYDDLREMQEMKDKQPGFVKWEAINYGKEKQVYTIKASKEQLRASQFGPREVQNYDEIRTPHENWSKVIEAAKTEYGFDSVQIQGNAGIVYKGSKLGIFLPGEEKKVYFFSKQYGIHHIKYFAAYMRNNWTKNAAAYIIATLNGKYGMMTETESEVLPFGYDNIEERDGFFLLTRNGKVGFFILNTFYPVIQPAWDKYISKQYLFVNSEWNFTLFRVEKNGKQGFVGENGIAYFRD